MSEFAYILDLKPASFRPIDANSNVAWGYIQSTHEFNPVAYSDSPMNPIAIISENGVIKFNNDQIPILPYKFQGNQQDAPEMFSFSPDGNPLDLDLSGNWQCMVTCQNETDCLYELAACPINCLDHGVSHWYALVKETHEGKSVWVKYNDDTVETLSVDEARSILSTHATDLIYRKVS
jgi:hypothetical protein